LSRFGGRDVRDDLVRFRVHVYLGQVPVVDDQVVRERAQDRRPAGPQEDQVGGDRLSLQYGPGDRGLGQRADPAGSPSLA
jgi:hypothetical protein